METAERPSREGKKDAGEAEAAARQAAEGGKRVKYLLTRPPSAVVQVPDDVDESHGEALANAAYELAMAGLPLCATCARIRQLNHTWFGRNAMPDMAATRFACVGHARATYGHMHAVQAVKIAKRKPKRKQMS